MTETQTFKVGDRVKTLGDVEGAISYGPFRSTSGRYVMYVVKDSAGNEQSYVDTGLTAAPAFAVGDTVTYEYGAGGKLVAGPFKSGYHDEAIWVVEKADGTHMTPTQNSLTKVDASSDDIKVGDRVRVLAAAHRDDVVDRVFTVRSTSETKTFHDDRVPGVHRFEVERVGATWDVFYARDVEKIPEPAANTYTHDGVTYDLTAKYRDREDDVWSFTRFGDVVTGAAFSDPPADDNIDLHHIVMEWGPLTRVTD